MSCPKCGSEGRLFSNFPGGGFPDQSVKSKEEIASLKAKIAIFEQSLRVIQSQTHGHCDEFSERVYILCENALKETR